MTSILTHDETPSPEAPEDVSRIRDLSSRWTRAVARKDPDGLAGLLADRTVLLPPNADSIKGRDQVSRAWETLLDLPGLRVTFEPHRTNVYPTGEVTHDIARYRLSWDGPDGDRIHDHGNHLIVWERNGGDGDEAWKVRSNVFYSKSLDRPCPLAAGNGNGRQPSSALGNHR